MDIIKRRKVIIRGIINAKSVDRVSSVCSSFIPIDDETKKNINMIPNNFMIYERLP